MDIVYDPHARVRMHERAVAGAEVESALRSHEIELPARQGRRHRYKQIAGQRIRVTFDVIGQDKYYIWTVTKDEVT